MQFTGENNFYPGGGKDFPDIIASVLVRRLAMPHRGATGTEPNRAATSSWYIRIRAQSNRLRML
jgi:hypothetical protein